MQSLAFPQGEFSIAVLQAVITVALALLCGVLWRRTGRAHFLWWGTAFALFLVRITMIVVFLAVGDRRWLFWHQVVTGWTGLALLWAAATFAGAAQWRRWYAIFVAFPPVWSFIAVIRLESFRLAAVPAVLFLAGATFWTGIVLLRNRRGDTSGSSALLGWTFLLWGVHHLDYPLLRAQGAWHPWGYYIDILFLLMVGAGILLQVNAELAAGLRARTTELERLSRRMVQQHEEERRRLSLELHDETAQVFASLKLHLGVVRERVQPTEPALGERLDRALGLVDDGMRSIRNVTNDLRPSLLDDLGLLPALRSLVADVHERRGVSASFEAPDTLPPLSDEAEVALFRALQEALTNVARHAAGARASITLTVTDSDVRLRVTDTGPGFHAGGTLEAFEAAGHLGLVGMRERLVALGGRMVVGAAATGGVAIEVQLPVSAR